MPPEVIKGQPYDSKADVWAIGIILYELITLRKPFDCETIQGVFKKVVEEPFEPLPPNTDINLQILVDALLNKDYNKRPNIYDVAKIPCMTKYIIKFVEDHNCKEEVINIFNVDAAKLALGKNSSSSREEDLPGS